jgi:hypothetical protein
VPSLDTFLIHQPSPQRNRTKRLENINDEKIA